MSMTGLKTIPMEILEEDVFYQARLNTVFSKN